MALSYQQIAATLNIRFKDKASVKHAALDFQNKHGPKGHGEGGKTPYRFGNFVSSDPGVVDPAKQAKWLIDTGKRNWDASFDSLQDLIRDNLSDTGQQIPMKFSITQGNAPKASAAWQLKTDPNGEPYYEVQLVCRTEPT